MGPVGSLIGQEAALRGSFTSKQSIHVEGEIYGNVSSDDGIIVGTKGMIRGNVTGRSIVIGGRVKGNIIASQRIELQSTAQVEGDLSAPILLIEEGAIFEGSCVMEDADKVVDLQKAKEN
jgi:cytoskeletal protein CcmA (bactofilin family)